MKEVETPRYIDPEDYDDLVFYVKHLEKVLDRYVKSMRKFNQRYGEE